MALQRRADALVLLTALDLVWELPGKMFEYIGARRPILALADDNEAARVVRETGTASPSRRATSAPSMTALACRLHDTERYEYPAPALAMAAEIDRAIGARRSREIR